MYSFIYISKSVVTCILVFLLVLPSHVFALDINTYRDDSLGFEVSYPRTWSRVSSPGDPPFFIQNRDKAATMSLRVANFTGNKNTFMNDLRSYPQQVMDKIRKRFPSAKLDDHGDTYLGGFPAYYFQYTYNLRNLDISIDVSALQVFSIRDKKLYFVNFEAPVSYYGSAYEDLRKILATFNYR